jgi:hypothetical protein
MTAGYRIENEDTLEWKETDGKYASIGQITDIDLKKIKNISMNTIIKIIEEKMAKPKERTSSFFDKFMVVKKDTRKVHLNSAKSVIIAFVHGLRIFQKIEHKGDFTELFLWAKKHINEPQANTRVVDLFNASWNHYFPGKENKPIDEIKAIFNNPTQFITSNQTPTAPEEEPDEVHA